MEKEKLEMVLEDIIDDLKTVSNLLQEQRQQGVELEEKVSLVEVKINQLNQEKSFLHKEPVENIIADAIVEIKKSIEEKPQPIIRQWRLLLFPETYSKEYYCVYSGYYMGNACVCNCCSLYVG